MNVVEKEITRWELPGVDFANVYRADRTDAIQLWWTPVEELKAFALNVFSPVGHVLWNVNAYRAFADGAFAYTQRLLQNESTVGTLNAVIRDAGAELRSDVAYKLLGGFTRAYGDRYEPPRSLLPAFLSGHRHLSVAVPDSCQPMVSRYFQEQARAFGESATRPCPEHERLVLTGEGDEQSLFGLLCKSVAAMSDSQRHSCLALMRSGVELLATDASEQFKFTGNAGVAISALGVAPDCPWLGDFAAIARYRVEAAVRHYALPGIEKLKGDLAAKEWGVLCLADLRDALRGQLNAALAGHPVIESNPFELAER